VEPDKIVHVASLETQLNPPWGLSAISNANPPDPNSSYFYDSTAGEGTFSYVFDSGILLEHVEFEGRAEAGVATITGQTDRLHGTLVSAIVGGATYGVAKKTTLIDVTVVGDSAGSLATVLDGIDWALNDIVSKGRVGKSVVNMSLATTSSPTFNDAVQAMIDAGIPVAAAAGNSNDPAANWSPANQPNVVTVGASSREYRRASFSNWGPEVDIFAPGVRILTASSEGPNATITTDGTSEASPHVAGVIAYLLGLEGPRTPAEVKERLLQLAVTDLVEDPQGSANLFLYNGIGK
jgi:subtilisin family serine protease